MPQPHAAESSFRSRGATDARSRTVCLGLAFGLWLAVLTTTGTAVAAGGGPGDATSWRSLGPEGGEVRALLVDPAVEGRIFAGTLGGRVFVSDDGGDSWSPVAPGLLVAWINDLALAPGAGGTLYAATDQGVFRLPAASGVWEPASLGLPPKPEVSRLAIDPRTPTTLYATVARNRISGYWDLYRSTDGGGSWADISGGVLLGPAIAVAPTSPPTLHAVSFSDLYRTTDGGATWSRSREGLPLGFIVGDLAVDPGSPTVLYGSLRPEGRFSSVSVFKSVDGGLTWTEAGQGLGDSREPGRLAIDAGGSGALYLAGELGVYRSTDGAGSWSPANAPPADRQVVALAVDPSNGAVYAGPDRLGPGQDPLGILRSLDGGVSWRALIEGLDAGRIVGLSPDPRDPERLVVSTEGGGVRRSENDGATWTPARAGLADRRVGPLARDPFAPSTLYAVTGKGRFVLDQVHRSTDAGATWEPLGPERGCCLKAVVPDPVTPGTLFVVAYDRLFKSLDGGVTWEVVGDEICPGISALALPADASSPLLLGCTRDSGAPVSPAIVVTEIFRSDDGGATWEPVFEGPSFSVGAEWTLAFDPSDPSDVVAGVAGAVSRGGVFRSRDGGDTWQPAGLADEGIRTLLFDPRRPTWLYAGTASSGVLRSIDDGSSWTPFNPGLDSADVRVLAIDPLSPARLFAGTGGGLFVLEAREPSRARRLLD